MNLLTKLLKSALARTSAQFSRLLFIEEKKKEQQNNFIHKFYEFHKHSNNYHQRFILEEKDCTPLLDDDTGITTFDTHYVYHPAWAARIVKQVNPDYHVDISSTLHFCSLLSAFISVKFYDFRPAKLTLSNLESESADLTKLHFPDNSIASLSCMHTIEHIGLGRYGDPVDYDGDLKAAAELYRVLAPGGTLLMVTPVGKPKIMFNAHRIYAYRQIMEMFRDLELVEFSLVTDNALNEGMTFNATEKLSDKQNYGCGCFWFKKKSE
jgi:SAM-dependent methyltransferase